MGVVAVATFVGDPKEVIVVVGICTILVGIGGIPGMVGTIIGRVVCYKSSPIPHLIICSEQM